MNNYSINLSSYFGKSENVFMIIIKIVCNIKNKSIYAFKIRYLIFLLRTHYLQQNSQTVSHEQGKRI